MLFLCLVFKDWSQITWNRFACLAEQLSHTWCMIDNKTSSGNNGKQNWSGTLRWASVPFFKKCGTCNMRQKQWDEDILSFGTQETCSSNRCYKLPCGLLHMAYMWSDVYWVKRRMGKNVWKTNWKYHIMHHLVALLKCSGVHNHTWLGLDHV